MAKTVASIDQSVIIDLDGFSRTKQERFLAPFLDAFYEANRRPMLLFCDEADRYAPQKPMSQDAILSLSSSEDIARRGRKRGIGSFWLTQRTAVLNKNVSEFANLTVIFRTPGEKDLGELEDRVGRVSSRDVVKEVMRMAPGLADGEAIFLSAHPKLRKFMPDPVRPIQLPMPWTFDSSATPGVGHRRREPKVLAQADLATIESQMAEQVKRAKEDDPKELKRQIVELKRELAKKPQATAAAAKEKRVEVPVLKDAQISRLEKLSERLTKFSDDFVEKAKALMEPKWQGVCEIKEQLRQDIATVRQAIGRRNTAPQPATRPAVTLTASPRPQPARILPVRASAPAGDGRQFGAESAPSRCLAALAQIDDGYLSDKKLAARAGVSRKKSTFRNAMTDLGKQGLIEKHGDGRRLTEEGRIAAEHVPPLPTGEGLIEFYRREMGEGAPRRIFEALIEAGGGPVPRGDVGERAGIDLQTSTFRNAMTDLRTWDLVHGRDQLELNPDVVEALGR